MSIADTLSNFSGGLGSALYPSDPNLAGYVDPSVSQAARNNSLISLGLGIMAAPYDMRGLGHGLLGAYQGAQGDYQGAMQNAFKNTLLRKEADFQQAERELQVKQQQRSEREQAAQTAQRISSGMGAASDPSAYWNLVQNSPEVKDALSTLGVQAPYMGPMANPQNLQDFQRQLQAAGSVGAPAAPPIKLEAGSELVSGSDPTKVLASAAPKPINDLELHGVPIGNGMQQQYIFNKQTGAMTPFGKPVNTQMGDPNSVEQTAQMIANGQIPMLTGFALKTPWGQAVVARVGQLKPDYSAQDYTVGQQTRTAFAKGKQGDTVRSLNVAVQHLDTLGNLADALSNGNLPLFNKAANAWKTQTGQAAPTNFEAAKKIVADEVVKAIVGSGGALADREEAAKTINAASSPQQLKQAIATYQQLMAGQLSGLQRQYQQNTGRNDFERFVAPETKQKLESNGPPKGGSLSDADLLKKWGS